MGEVEQALATLWQEVLGLERVGRHDSFFALGGHSLRIITVIERLRQQGLHVEVRAAFSASTLAELAACVQRTQHNTEVPSVPPNLIDGSGSITPEHLTLLELSQKEIDGLVALIPGGSADIQDIYPLGPLQEGVLFHHLLGGEGDAYLLRSITRIETEETLQAFLSALRQVIARHDILRTSVHWEGLPRPVQVVHRQVSLPVERIVLFPDVEPADQLRQQVDPRRIRMDLGRPPLIQAFTAADPQGDGHWLVLLVHHLVCDHISLELLIHEVQAFMHGDSASLPAPLPYRSFIAKALATPDDVHAAYFREQLGDVEEPTAPFGVLDVHRSGAQVAEIRQTLPPALSFQLRSQARQWAVTPAALFHLAWGQVLARCCGRGDAVFGTVVSGRLQGLEGASRVVGMFINTLPLRLQLDGLDVGQAVLHAHKRLSELLDHEQASLVQAQRCSQVAAPLPLFTSLLNYRHSEATTAVSVFEGMHAVHDEERTNYPLTVSVDDLGEDFGTVVQVVQGLDAARIAAYFAQALESLAHALEKQPQQPVHTLEILPAAERETPFVTDAAPQLMGERTITACFEAVAVRQPDQAAVVMAGQTLSFDQLNRRANQLAHAIHAMGVIPGERVAIFSARGVELLIAVLAVLKAGAAYVPLDPAHPVSRIGYMLADSTPSAVLSTAAAAPLLQSLALTVPVVLLDDATHASQAECNPQQESLTSHNLAYVIYTSGSTGQPKGVMVEHHSVIRLWQGLNAEVFAHCPGVDRVSMNASLSFDASVQMWIQLLSGRCVVLIPQEVRLDADALLSYIDVHAIDVLDCTPAQLDGLLEAGLLDGHRAHPDAVLVGGDVLTATTWRQLQQSPRVQFFNVYGPTECTVDATVARIRADSGRPNIGHPLPQVKVCLRDRLGRPVPRGVTGEILLGGGQLARGYLGQPTLTAERFAEDLAAVGAHQAAPGPERLYRTGDLARLLEDGSYEYLGRNDHQVKIRGVRIELGEVESQLLLHPGIDQVVVTARGDYPGDRRLVAYFTSTAAAPPLAAELREMLASHLSEPMVPSAFVLMPHWPLSPNGKIDRKGLPVPNTESMSARCNEPPRGDAETAVAQIWQDVLGLPQIGRYDRFFELGGHSLSAIQVVVRLRRKFDVEIPMADLFAHSTVETLARHVVDLLMAKIGEEDMARLSDGLDDLSEAELLDLLEKEDQR
ncbi:non-ribosomal peptide synthetase [Stenotrophomonas lactitubi]|uniref:non-ribosomal peptide synthetase n=2 Tax=Stenotrophomonas TaxID=40323 RepID=UPI001C6FCD50|nr:non-ribosomal peptide synthetase [Stenotrophomonas lactitubi]